MLYTTDFSERPEFLKDLINWFSGSQELADMKTANAYYEGNNTFINNFQKKIVMKSPDGELKEMPNPFQSNKKIAVPVFKDMVDQKNYTLFANTPTVSGVSDETQKALFRPLDKNALLAGKQASINGCGFSFVSSGLKNDKLGVTTFDSRQCIPFWDETGEYITQFVRFWEKHSPINRETTYFAEVYTADGLSTWTATDHGGNYQKIKESPYRSKTIGSILGSEILGELWKAGLPIVPFRNNEQLKSDFSRGLKSAIDTYDFVLSDFANNIADLKETISVLENSRNFEGDTLAMLREFTKVVEATGVANLPKDTTYKHVQRKILYEAKESFIKQITSVIQTMTHTVNKDMALKGNLTATGIKLSQQDHRNFVKAFEYPAFDYIVGVVDFAKEFTGDTTTEEVDVSFQPDFLSNETEVIDNLVKLQGIVSDETILRNLTVVDNVEEEQERKKSENTSVFYTAGGNKVDQTGRTVV